MLSAVRLLRELIAIPTPSSVSNLPLLRWVQAFLEPRGWRVALLPYLDESGVEKANLIARPASMSSIFDSRIDLAFVCHTDTVPYATDWSHALIAGEREGHLHGCGSCDVKGSLACFLAAVSNLDQGAIAPGVALILTADEEIGCKGMERLLATANLSIGSAIVSEPTSLRPGVAGKGYGLARITVEGREAHSAFPQQGVSAISIAARLIAKIDDDFTGERENMLTDSLFDPPRTTINIGTIEGGTAKNIIPGRCTFLVEWRAIPGEKATAVLNDLQALVLAANEDEPRAEICVEGLRAEPGFAPAAIGVLQAQLDRLLATQPIGISFGSEASRLARIADEVIVIGPGDMRTAHSDRECVPLAELEKWSEVLRELVHT